jgi:hypothetical protein
MIDAVTGLFYPFTDISSELQQTFRLERAPACRSEHGRLEILLRGAGITDQPLEQRLALARSLTDAIRPLLRRRSKREHRRLAERAISVVFEDEAVVGEGIATSRFSYLASHDPEPPKKR